MNATELRSKNDQELSDLLLEMRRKQFNMRMQGGAGQPARPSEIQQARKDIARIKTIIRERQQGDTA